MQGLLRYYFQLSSWFAIGTKRWMDSARSALGYCLTALWHFCLFFGSKGVFWHSQIEISGSFGWSLWLWKVQCIAAGARGHILNALSTTNTSHTLDEEHAILRRYWLRSDTCFTAVHIKKELRKTYDWRMTKAFTSTNGCRGFWRKAAKIFSHRALAPLCPYSTRLLLAQIL